MKLVMPCVTGTQRLDPARVLHDQLPAAPANHPRATSSWNDAPQSSKTGTGLYGRELVSLHLDCTDRG